MNVNSFIDRARLTEKSPAKSDVLSEARENLPDREIFHKRFLWTFFGRYFPFGPAGKPFKDSHLSSLALAPPERSMNGGLIGLTERSHKWTRMHTNGEGQPVLQLRSPLSSCFRTIQAQPQKPKGGGYVAVSAAPSH